LSARPSLFGRLADGAPVQAVRLAWPGGLAVQVLDYGAIVQSLTVPAAGGRVEALLGFPDPAAYEADRFYQGQAIGRCANRIGGAAFSIDGRDYRVTANEGRNCLHGGRLGFGRRTWRFEALADDGRSATLAYRSPDGEEGFPGEVEARVRFAVDGPDSFSILWEAEADRPTPVSMTHHLYFNLSGDPRRSALDHQMRIAAEAVTPVRPDLVPTGELMPVAGTPFDLRRPRPLREALAQAHPQTELAGGFDHNWALSGGAGPAAILRSPRTGLELAIDTDQPGLQMFSGQTLEAPFARHGGIALEPQAFPDALHHRNFPGVVLRPGSLYRRWASYRFAAGDPDEGR